MIKLQAPFSYSVTRLIALLSAPLHSLQRRRDDRRRSPLKQSGMAVGELLVLTIPMCVLCMALASKLSATASSRVESQWRTSLAAQQATKEPSSDTDMEMTAPIMAVLGDAKVSKAAEPLAVSLLPNSQPLPFVSKKTIEQSLNVRDYFYRTAAEHAVPDGINQVTTSATFVCNEPQHGDKRRDEYKALLIGLGEEQAATLFGNGVSEPEPIAEVATGTHIALSVCTLIPGPVGTVCAAKDAQLYFKEGDYVNGFISGLGAVPLLGDIVGGVRLAKAARRATEVVQSINADKSVARGVQEGSQFTKAASSEKNAANAAKDSPVSMCNGNCFTADTPVLTPSGPQPIAQIQAGDLVLSQNEETGEQIWRTVLQRFVTTNRELMALRLQAANGTTEVIRTTATHPFYANGRGFIEAGALHQGDELASADGTTVVVIGSMPLAQAETVYNLEIEDFHTYFVGSVRAWVHNMGACVPCPEGLPSRRGAFKAAKRDAGIPSNKHPDGISSKDLTRRDGTRIKDANGRPIEAREYEFTRPDGKKIVIQDHGAGHSFGEGGVGDQGPHFNVRPSGNTRTGKVPGTEPHYPFAK